MKFIKWDCFHEIEAYTTCSYCNGELMNMSFNGIDDQQVLKNREKLAQTLHTDLNHMVATHQRHTTNFLKVQLQDGGRGMNRYTYRQL